MANIFRHKESKKLYTIEYLKGEIELKDLLYPEVL